MDAAMLTLPDASNTTTAMAYGAEAQVVDAIEFRRLLVSHRRMVRVDRMAERMRGLRDLDTGEVFLVDERRLLEMRR